MTWLGTWDNLRVASVPPHYLDGPRIPEDGADSREPRVGQTVVRIRSFNYPNNQFGHKYGKGLS